MAAKNGYAQLVVRGEDTNVIIYPPQEGGAPVDVKRLVSYLDRNLLDQYDLKALSDACGTMDEPKELHVGIAPFRPFNEIMEMDVSADKMLVFCRFYPASEGGSIMDEREIVQQIQQNKIRFGIDGEAIQKFLANKEYNKDYVFAKGQPARQGQDAKIEYFFNTSLNTKPKKNPDGTVDYHDLNTVSMVQKGQCLARLTPPDLGDPGTDVFGDDIKPRNVKELRLEFGHNITLSEDGTEIYTEVTGHATVQSGKVFVSDVLEIPADVDTSTGDIQYDGSVLIHGNVKSGFKVIAKGDVIVEGVVEGAIVQSGGQIVIKRGIHGMEKGVLDAKGNILCKFVENAKVYSGGYLETEGIMHSKVNVSSEVIVKGKKSLIAGGVVRAGSKVETDTLGSEMGAITRIEVGVEPARKSQFLELQNQLDEKIKSMNSIRPILDNYSKKMAAGEQLPEDKAAYIQKLVISFKNLQKEIAPLKEQLEELKIEIANGSDARVKVLKTAYPGSTVCISDVSLTVKEPRSFCQFVRDQGDVVIRNL